MLDDIETFLCVAEKNNFSTAAYILRLSVSQVSRIISKLEENIGTKLLLRTTRNVRLTAAGEHFYERCKQIKNDFEDLKSSTLDIYAKPRGVLKIGCPVSISYIHLYSRLQPFIEKYPEISFKIIDGNHLKNIISDGFDLVIHCGEVKDSELVAKKLAPWTKIICASPEYFKKHGTPMHPDELLKYNCVDHNDNKLNSWLFKFPEGLKRIPVEGNMHMGSSIALREAALNSLGIVRLPTFTVSDDIKTKKLIEIFREYREENLGIYAVYTKYKMLPQKTKVFLEYLEKEIFADLNKICALSFS